MARLNAAWAVLGNPRTRSDFDRQQAVRAPSVSLDGDPPFTSSREVDALSKPIHRRSARPPNGAAAVILDFGRYAGLPLGRIAQIDPDYLRWLGRVPTGQRLRGHIESVLGESRPISR
jgi:hypothetical protein